MKMIMAKTIYKEKQKMRRWDVLALLGFFLIGLSYRFIETLIYDTDNINILMMYLPWMVLLGVSIYYFLKIELAVKITDDYIGMKYGPFQNKQHKIKWEDISNCEVIETPELAQWNGWNVHFSREKVYSVNGKNGIHLRTNEGEEYFIGSRRLGELKKIIKDKFKK